MFRLIEAHCDSVVASILPAHVRDYDWLVENLRRVGESQYQARYRAFWAMNAARLSPSYCAEYFRRLEADCDAFIASVREVVHRIVNDPDVSNAIVALSQQLESRSRLWGKEVRRFLEDRGLHSGVAASRLPPAPG